jgi:hypothetical protein
VLYCNIFVGSISQWNFITLKIQYTTLDYSQQLYNARPNSTSSLTQLPNYTPNTTGASYLFAFQNTTLLQSVALRIMSNRYSFCNTTHNFMRSPLSSHRHFHSNVSVYIVAWKRLFSLLRYRGNATMPQHPIVAQQEAEATLPRKPNM